MYSVSELFKVLVGYRDRQFELKAVVDGVEYLDDQVVDFEIEDSLVLEEDFTIGTVNASKLIISLRTLNTIATNAKITPYIRLKGITWAQAALLWEDADFDWAATGSEWLKLGDFYIESRSLLRNHLQRFTCLDKLITAAQPFTTSLVYPETMQNVFDEIMTTLGMTADSSVVIDASYEIPYEPDGADYSFRDILSYIASSNSSSIKMTKNGEVGFVKFNTGATATSIGEDLYITAEQTNPVKTITKIVVTYNSEGETLEEGTGDEENTLYLYNPFITEDIIDDMFAQLEDFSYTPYSLLWRGNVYLETGDNISITVPNVLTWEDAKLPWADADFPWEQDSLTYESLILQNKMTFRGGLITSSQAQAKSYQETEFDYKGSISETVKNLDKDAVKLEEAYYGVVIGRTSGINIEKSDSSSKVTFNSDVLEWTVGGVQKLSYNSVEDRLDYTGSIVITAGSGIANLADAGGLATEDAADFDTQVDGAEKPENNATVGADWSSNLLNIPGTLGTPSGTGLFLSAANLGYYDSGVWKTYMDNSGNFYLGGTSGKLQWDAVGDALTIMGSVTITAGSGIANLSDAGDLATRDTVNETYIDDNSISTPKLQAGAVTATEIDVDELSAISADLGDVTSGTMEIGTTNKIKIYNYSNDGIMRLLNSVGTSMGYLMFDDTSVALCTQNSAPLFISSNAHADFVATNALGFTSNNSDIELDAGLDIDLLADDDILLDAGDNITLDASDNINLIAGQNLDIDITGDVDIDALDISLNPLGNAYYNDGVSGSDEIATRGWVENNHRLDTISAGTGISITGTTYDKTIALDLSYTDGRYVEAGTGGTKTIDYINATATGLIVWFTDATNETIYYD
jgi:hypothetical protein